MAEHQWRGDLRYSPVEIYGEGSTKVATGSLHDVKTGNYTPEDLRFLAWPTNGEAVIQSLALTVGNKPVQTVILLGSDPKLKFEQRADCLHVQLPAQPPAK
jgi:alpha-L-fucosidase